MAGQVEFLEVPLETEPESDWDFEGNGGSAEDPSAEIEDERRCRPLLLEGGVLF